MKTAAANCKGAISAFKVDMPFSKYPNWSYSSGSVSATTQRPFLARPIQVSRDMVVCLVCMSE